MNFFSLSLLSLSLSFLFFCAKHEEDKKNLQLRAINTMFFFVICCLSIGLFFSFLVCLDMTLSNYFRHMSLYGMSLVLFASLLLNIGNILLLSYSFLADNGCYSKSEFIYYNINHESQNEKKIDSNKES